MQRSWRSPVLEQALFLHPEQARAGHRVVHQGRHGRGHVGMIRRCVRHFCSTPRGQRRTPCPRLRCQGGTWRARSRRQRIDHVEQHRDVVQWRPVHRIDATHRTGRRALVRACTAFAADPARASERSGLGIRRIECPGDRSDRSAMKTHGLPDQAGSRQLTNAFLARSIAADARQDCV